MRSSSGGRSGSRAPGSGISLRTRRVRISTSPLLPHKRLAGHRLGEHDAHRVDVGAAVRVHPGGLLRRHVRDLALEDTGLRLLGLVRRLGDAEIDDLHLAIVGEEHVLRVDVAVHDLERRAGVILQVVRVLERREDLADHPQVHRAGEGAVAELLAPPDHALERAALEVLHRHEVAPVLLADLVRLHDVRVMPGGRRGAPRRETSRGTWARRPDPASAP